jgi:hypothetical protein
MFAACLLLAVGLGTPKLVFAEKYDAAFEEAAARNVPVLIVDFDNWATSAGNPQVSEFFDDKEFGQTASDHAVLLLASNVDHGERKETVGGRTTSVCSEYGSVPCKAHKDVLPKLFADFAKDGQIVSPLFLVASPARKEIARFEHEQHPPAVTAQLKNAAKKLGDGMTRSDYLRLRHGLAEIEESTTLGEFDFAVATCDELSKIPGKLPLNADVAAAARKLDEAGKAKVKRADELWTAGRFGEALLDMEDVRASFGKLAAASEAAAKVAAWEKAPDAKSHLAELKDDRAARALFEQAVQFARKKDVKRTEQQVEKLSRAFPDSRFKNRLNRLVEEAKAPAH